MTIKERIAKYKKKSLFAKLSDLLFIVFIVAMLTPSGRFVILSFVNRIKSMVIEPSERTSENAVQLKSSDYNWQLRTVNGKQVNLSDYKNKVIFLNFWATWCPSCVGEMPAIQELYNSYKNDDNIVFILASSEAAQTVNAFIKKRGYNLPFFTYSTRQPDIFKLSVLPTTFIISKQGKIVVQETGASKWNGKKVKTLIDKLKTEQFE